MKLKTNTNQQGFTIVELLIVIVVIGILAAITIVAYNGIQNRAKTSAGQSLANNVVKKTEAYYTTQSKYPTLAELKAATDEAKLDKPDDVVTGPVTETTAEGGKKAGYASCADGANITYWSYTAKELVTVKAGAGCA